MRNIILLIYLACSLSVSAQMHEEWSAVVGDYPDGTMYAGNMVLDDDGNSYLYYMYHNGIEPNCILKKFDSNGVLLLQVDSIPFSQYPDMARNGGLYFHEGSLYYLNYEGVIKYNTQLQEVWRYDDMLSFDMGFGRLAFDTNDEIIITYPQSNPGINTTSYFYVKKISGNGDLIWQDVYLYNIVYASYYTLLDSANRFYIGYTVEENYVNKQILHQYGAYGLNWTYERSGSPQADGPFMPQIQPNGDIWAIFCPSGTVVRNMCIINPDNGQLIAFSSAVPPMPFLFLDSAKYYMEGGASNFFTLVKKRNGTPVASRNFNTIFYNAIHFSNEFFYVVGKPFNSLNDIYVFKLDTNLNLVQTFIHSYSNTVYNDKVFTESQIDSNGHLYFYASSHGVSAEIYRVCENCKGNITGDIVYDVNQNCLLDSTEQKLGNRLVELIPGPTYAFTDPDGHYSFRRPNGDYTVKTVPPAYWQSVCSDSIGISLDSANYAAHDNSFYWYASPGLKSKEISISTGEASIGFDQYISISYSNSGTTVDSGTVVLLLDSAFNFVVSDPMPDSILGNRLVWNYNDLNVLEARDILLAATPPNVLGYLYTHVCTITPLLYDVFPNDNIDSKSGDVVGSYDPNDKNCEVLNDNGQGFLTDSSTLRYTVRFQNTGTDTAINIIVMDTLDEHLNLATFRMLQSSHPYQVSILGDRILKWTFGNIMLPDSHANQILSNGFIKYAIKPLSGLTVGDAIANSASIYFDWNLPIKTNTTINYYENLVGISDVNSKPIVIKLRPNPFKYIANVDVHTTSNAPIDLLVYDLSGRLQWQEKFLNSKDLILQRNELSSGMYLLDVRQSGLSLGFSRFIID